MKLFAIYLGGRAKKCNTELHDVVFSYGNKIEDTYIDLLEKWFGQPDRLHLDSWVILNYIDGYEIILKKTKSFDNNKLYFINLGWYDPNKFEELHESKFMIGSTDKEVKKRAKSSLLIGSTQVHTDDLYDVDDCIEINRVGKYYIHLKKSSIRKELEFNNGYYPIPHKIIKAYKESNLL